MIHIYKVHPTSFTSFTSLPSNITLNILEFIDDDIKSISNLSITSKPIRNYFKSESPLLIFTIEKLVEELHLYKFITKTYKSINPV